MASLLSKVYVKIKELPRKQAARLLPLKRRELRAVLKLFYQEGWVDFTLADLEFMYSMSPDTCFKFAMDDGVMIGVTFALLLDNGVCYPNSSVIAEKYRNQVKFHGEVLKYADVLKKIAKYEIMYAAHWLVDLYKDGMGYRPAGKIKRLLLTRAATVTDESFVSLDQGNLEQIAEFLQPVYNSERRSILGHALELDFKTACVIRDGQVAGFAMRRALPKYDQIGPVVSADPKLAAALIAQLLGADNERPVIIDGDIQRLPALLRQAGIDFTESEVEMTKMVRGDEAFRENEDMIHAIYSHYLS